MKPIRPTVSEEDLPKQTSDTRPEPQCGAAAPPAAMAAVPPPNAPDTRATLTPSQLPLVDPSRPVVPGYEVLEELGRGGMGVVYRAQQLKAKRLVALKMILHKAHASLEQRLRFQIEAEAVARFQHPNIVQLYEVGEHDGLPFLSLEFCEGGNLDRQLQGKPLPVREAAALVEKLARAMHYAHIRGILHRDLKPANVLLTADGEPKITDFGLAKRLYSVSALSHSGAVMGTPSYMAPEQAAGAIHDVGPTADVYALGVILFECLTGQPPFKDTAPFNALYCVLHTEPIAPSRFNIKVPRDLDTICLKCLRKDPAHRYSSAGELAERLRLILDGKPIPDRPMSSLERAVMWVRRCPGTATLLASLVIVTVLGVAGVLWKYLEADAERKKANDLAEDYRKEKDLAAEKTAAAENAELKARDALTRAEGLNYASTLAKAQQRWQVGDVAAARQLLQSARWDYRGWEYAHLRYFFDETQATLRGHSAPVTSLCFSPDGKRLASAGGRLGKPGEVRVWDAGTGRAVLIFSAHSDRVRSVCFSPDGNRLATGGDDGTVNVCNALTGQDTITFNGQTNRIRAVCFSPNGKCIASADDDQKVRVWGADTGRLLLTLNGHTDRVTDVHFSPDGKRLASAGWDAKVILWDAGTGAELHTLQGHTATVTSVCFSPDGTRLASGSADHTIRVWDCATGQVLYTRTKHADRVTDVRFCPDGNRLVTASWDKTVKVSDAIAGHVLLTFKGHTGHVRAVCFSPDGKRLASASDDETVKVWDATADQEVFTLQGHSGDVRNVSFSPDGQRLASASDDKTVKVWNADTGQMLLTFQGHVDRVAGVVFSPNGQRLASAGRDRTVRVWDATTGKELMAPLWHADPVTGVAFSSDGKHIVTGTGTIDRPGELKLWDAATGREIRVMHGHTGGVTGVGFSPDGQRLASGGEDKTVRVWDVATGRELLTLKGHTGAVTGVCFSPHGNRLASASEDKTAILWDTGTGREILALKGNTNGVTVVRFSPDGKRLASASAAGTVKIWNAATGHEVLTLKGHVGAVWDLEFSPDGKRLAGGSSDNTVTVWDTAAGQELAPLRGQNEDVDDVGFSADGNRIVALSHAGEVISWDVSSGQEIVPCTDPAPPAGQHEAVSSDGGLTIRAEGHTVLVRRVDDNRSSSDLVFLTRLNDVSRRLLWHNAEAADNEAKQQWFAAAFHLRHLIAANEADVDRARERLKHCEDKLRQP